MKNNKKTLEQEQEQEQAQRRLSMEVTNHQNDISPVLQANLISDDNPDGIISPLLIKNDPIKGLIDNDGLTCDTDIIKNENEAYDDELLSDENDVTIHQTTSYGGEKTSSISNRSPLLTRNNNTEDFRIRSKSDGHTLKDLALKYADDNKSLR